MTYQTLCPFCDTNHVEVKLYSDTLTNGIVVTDLKQLYCKVCEEATIPLPMYEENRQKYKEALRSAA